MKRVAQDDPTWSRSLQSNKAKKQKMASRASMRLIKSLILKKRKLDKRKEKAICVTRTVELLSAQDIGNESKLLFMLAIGLTPKLDDVKSHFPVVELERLDPAVEAEARARTRDVIYQIFQRRKVESLQRRINPNLSAPHESVEVVDLVSSNDECSSSEDEAEPLIIEDTYMARDHPPIGQRSTFIVPRNVCTELPNYRIISCSQPQPRQPVFKQLVNNQDSGIFRNWKPESIPQLINKNNPDKDSSNSHQSSKKSDSKFISSLKSFSSKAVVISKSNFKTVMSTGGSCKNQNHGAGEEVSSPSHVTEFVVPETIITID